MKDISSYLSSIFSDSASECGNLWEEKKVDGPLLLSSSSDFVHFAACTRQLREKSALERKKEGEEKVVLNTL